MLNLLWLKILKKKYLLEEDKIIIDGEGYFLAPTNPDVNVHLIKVIAELTQNYQIDGIHYDYIRYHSEHYGYNKIGLSIFSENHLIDLLMISIVIS